jgi:antitoxin component of MazEF toxin-antitoxin module
MFFGKLDRDGNRYVVVIPHEQVDALRLEAGDLLAVWIQRAPSAAVRAAFEASWRDNEEGYRYLAGR